MRRGPAPPEDDDEGARYVAELDRQIEDSIRTDDEEDEGERLLAEIDRLIENNLAEASGSGGRRLEASGGRQQRSDSLSTVRRIRTGRYKRYGLGLFGLLFFVLLMRAGSPNTLQDASLIASTEVASPPWYPSPRGGTTKTWEKSYLKAERMVSQMSLIEKVNVTTGTGWMMGMCVGNTAPADGVGFPSLCLQDGPIAARFADNITAGPAGITVGATWNKALMYKRGRMMGIEAKSKGINAVLGPAVGALGRSPLGGRNWEGFGSDPVLQGIAAAQTIQGIQNEGVMATVKHFVGNEQEHFRQPYEWGIPVALSSNIDERTLHELYAWPFADAVRSGVASVMCSYQQVNNSHACQNSKLLNGVLKDELGFQGFVQSDWLAQRSGVAAALAGLDMSMPGDGETWSNGEPFWGQHLTTAVLNSSLPLSRLNDMVTRIVAAWYQLEQDNDYLWPKPPPLGDGGPNFSSWTDDEIGLLHPGSDDESTGVVNQFVDAKNMGTFSHRSLARRVAAEAITLLKNDRNTLPLSRNARSQAEELLSPSGRKGKVRVGIYGEDAAMAPNGPNACPDRNCNQGTLAMGWGSGSVEFPYLVAPLDALREGFYKETVELSEHPTNDISSKTDLEALTKQHVCIVFVNADSGEGYIAWQGIRGDRNDLRLQNNGEQLVADVASNCGKKQYSAAEPGKPATVEYGDVIVVIHSVGPVLLESFIELPQVRAVVLAHLPGQESGLALADVLFGDVNPSGHLPYTIGRSIEQYGPSASIVTEPTSIVPQQNFSEGLYIDYRHFDKNGLVPRYEFGHGLTYTNFDIRNLLVQSMLAKDSRPSRLPTARPPEECQPPEYSDVPPDAADAVFPLGFRRLKKYIYPYIESPSDVKSGAYPYPPMEHHFSPAGGGEGGNPSLWDVLVRVHMTVANLGERSGQAVPQLYVGFPDDVWEAVPGEVQDRPSDSPDTTPLGPRREKIDFPLRVLRAFEKVHLDGSATSGAAKAVGETKIITLELTRRDLSYWSVREQNWVLPDGSFSIEVGFSSRDILVRGKVF